MKIVGVLASLFNRNRRVLVGKFVAIPVLVTGIGIFAGEFARTTIALAQSEEKVIKLDTQTWNPQVKFSELTVGQSARHFETKFQDSGDWLRRTAFEVENISDKEIIALQIRLKFPETQATGNEMNYTFMLGNRPGLPPNVPKNTLPPLSLKKGEKVAIRLASEYDRMAKFIATRTDITTLNKVQLEASFIFFSDGTAFRIGTFLRQDPTNASRWLPIEESAKEGKP